MNNRLKFAIAAIPPLALASLFVTGCDRKMSVPQNQLVASDVEFILACRPDATPVTSAFSDAAGNTATSACKTDSRGDGLVFEMAYTRDGAAYKTSVEATRISPAVYRMDKIVLDNVPQKLDDAEDTFAMLNRVGMQYRGFASSAILNPSVPRPHHGALKLNK